MSKPILTLKERETYPKLYLGYVDLVDKCLAETEKGLIVLMQLLLFPVMILLVLGFALTAPIFKKKESDTPDKVQS